MAMCPLCLCNNTIVVQRTNKQKPNWRSRRIKKNTHTLPERYTQTHTHSHAYIQIRQAKDWAECGWRERERHGRQVERKRKRYLFHFVYLAIVCVFLLQPLPLPLLLLCAFFLPLSNIHPEEEKKLKFCSCFASINAWLANFGTEREKKTIRENRLQSPPQQQQLLFSGCIFFGQFSLTIATSSECFV